MIDQIKSNLYACAHCGGTGTCKNGPDGSSCSACIKRNELKGKVYSGLLCGSCSGIGMAEPITERINKRVKPLLAMGIVFVILTLIFFFAFTKNENFSQILTFSSTLIGSIIGYYFSGSKNV